MAGEAVRQAGVLGMPPLQAQAQRLVGQLDARTPGLTGREHEVADRMAAELTNLSSLVRMYPDALNRVLRGAAGPRRSRRRQPLDAEAAAILGAVRRACATGATVLIIEDVLDDEHPDVRGHILDVIMLAVTGRERTPTELGAPLAHTGFHLRRVWTPAAHWRSSRRSPSPLPPERS